MHSRAVLLPLAQMAIQQQFCILRSCQPPATSFQLL